ncbi:3-isopropylmalate dehydrogenase [Chromatiales bacterium (ex Bugula neritina AB1)]|nr:3-isopropylmalate dehydrogenase [Chromatiales bacterium (ex Bugula neritina AB1)]
MNNATILLLPGDGIGPEVVAELSRVISWFSDKRGITFDITTDDVGGAAYERYGNPLADSTLEVAKQVDAIVMGSVGGPQWDNVERHLRPEAGLLTLRKELDLFANLRPATCRPALASASSLHEELVSGLDILILRELTAGVYFGEPRGTETLDDGRRRAFDTQVYFESEIERLMHVGFELAAKRNSKVHSVEKANVMESGVFWREIATRVGKEYPNITLEHMYADNCAMQLVRQPKQFDVIATDNLFGDILSDCAAMLTGSLGMLPSASLGVEVNGKRAALYEPVHGSAPDIAGQGKANPLATILSFAMCLRFSLDRNDDADLLEAAVDQVLADNIRTVDIAASGVAPVSTSEMGTALLRALDKLNA